MVVDDRYVRQRRLPQLGDAGQERLLASSAAVIGCGALGCAQAQFLVRSGVGTIRIFDRDFVELANLHRQILFDEEDAAERRPKAEAAAAKLRAMNGSVTVEATVADVTAANIQEIVETSDVVLDATDNIETRYILNDACVKHDTPWVYGGVMATEGLSMPIVPGSGPCLRCVFPDRPAPGTLPTGDVAGILGTGPTLVAALQATAALRILSGSFEDAHLLFVDPWTYSARRIAVTREPACPCCGERRFEFLDAKEGSVATVVAESDAVRISPLNPVTIDLSALARRLDGVIQAVSLEGQELRLKAAGHDIVVFADGNAIVHGSVDPSEARVLYARFVGT